MAITASTISSTQTLEEFRLEFNKLRSDVSTLESPTYGASITFEGATADAYETTLTVTDPTADRTITLPNATGTVVISGSAFDIDDLDIDGGDDIGEAIVDADLFIIDNGAGGTNRKTAASRLATYVGASAGAFSLANLDIDGGTDIGAAIVDADLFIVDDGAGGTNRKTAASRLATYVEAGISGDISISGGTAAIGSGVILNADINASAAIAWSKLATDGLDTTVSKINLKDYGEVTNAIGATGGGTQDIDLTAGNSVSATVDTSTNTFTFSDPTASDELCGFTLTLVNGGSQTVYWPGSVDWAGGTAPTLTTSGTDILTFFTIDGGTIWHGAIAIADSK